MKMRRREFLAAAAASLATAAEAANPNGRALVLLGRATLQPYLGQVATTRVPQFDETNNFYMNAVEPVQLLSDCDGLQISMPTFFAGGTLPPGDITYTVSIVNASNAVIGQFTWGSVASHLVAATTALDPLSDKLVFPFKKLTPYRFVTHAIGLSGILVNQPSVGTPDRAHGSACEVSSTFLADKTLSGFTAIGNSSVCFSPLRVVGTITAPSVLGIGDSLFEGGAGSQGDAFDGTSYYRGAAERSLAVLGIAMINLGVPGYRADSFVASHDRQILLQESATLMLCDLSSNDNAGGRTGFQINGDLASIWGYFPTKHVVQITMIDKTSSTGNWTAADRSDQTVAAGYGIGQTIDTVNNLILSKPAPLSAFVDYRSVIQSLSDYKWLADGVTAKKYTPDGIHSSTFAAQQVALSGAFTAAQFAR